MTPFDHAPVHFESGITSVPVVDRSTLGAGATFQGPMILTQLDTTTLVAPGWTGTVHQSGALLLTRKQDA